MTKRKDKETPPAGRVLRMPTAAQVEPAVMPEWLQGYGREFWREHEHHLTQAGYLDAVTSSLFMVLCIAYSQLREITDQIARDGMTIRTPTGRIVRHPALSEQVRTWRLYRQLSRDFFMAPRKQ